jgi:hypothetical protein
MKNPLGRLKTAWHTKLSGNLTISGNQVKVFREDADSAPGNFYVVIRAESATDESTADAHFTRPIIITDIITKFSGQTGIKDDIVESIDEQIKELVITSANNDALTDPSGFQFLCVSPQSESYLTEDDGQYKYYRKIVRWEHLSVQTI